MDDFAVCTQARESNGHILVKLDGNLRTGDVAKSDTDKLGRKRSVRTQLDPKHGDKALPAPASQEFWVLLDARGVWLLEFGFAAAAGPSCGEILLLDRAGNKSLSFFPMGYKVNTGKSRNGTPDSV